MPSNTITFIPDFVQIGQLTRQIKQGAQRRKYSMIVSQAYFISQKRKLGCAFFPKHNPARMHSFLGHCVCFRHCRFVSLLHICRLGSRSCEFCREEIAQVERKCYLSSLVKPSSFEKELPIILNQLCCFVSVVIFSIRHLLTGEVVLNSCVRCHSVKSDKYENSREQKRGKGKSGECHRQGQNLFNGGLENVYTSQFKVSKFYIIWQLLSVQGYISDANVRVFRSHFLRTRTVNKLREKL